MINISNVMEILFSFRKHFQLVIHSSYPIDDMIMKGQMAVEIGEWR